MSEAMIPCRRCRTTLIEPRAKFCPECIPVERDERTTRALDVWMLRGTLTACASVLVLMIPTQKWIAGLLWTFSPMLLAWSIVLVKLLTLPKVPR